MSKMEKAKAVEKVKVSSKICAKLKPSKHQANLQPHSENALPLCVHSANLVDGNKFLQHLDLQKIPKRNVNAAPYESCHLNQTLLKKNAEITELKRSMESLNHVINYVPNEEYAFNPVGVKLIDVIKRNRYLQVQLEQSRVLLNKKESIIGKLQKEVLSLKKKSSQEKDDTQHNKEFIEELRYEFFKLEKQINILRSKNSELQNLLNLAQKILKQEIGGDFDLTACGIRIGHSNWLGRAQQLKQYQQREKHLLKEIEICKKKLSDTLGLSPHAKNRDVDLLFSTTKNEINELDIHGSTLELNPNLNSNNNNGNPKQHLCLDRNEVVLKLEYSNTKLLAMKIRYDFLRKNSEELRKRLSTMQKAAFACKAELKTQQSLYESRIALLTEELQLTLKDRETAFKTLEELSAQVVLLKKGLQKTDHEVDLIRKTYDERKHRSYELRKDEVIQVIRNLEADKKHLKKDNSLLKQSLLTERSQIAALKLQIRNMEFKIGNAQ